LSDEYENLKCISEEEGGDAKEAPKSKLEEGISAEDAVQGGAKRK
jgi:hypothetical protein